MHHHDTIMVYIMNTDQGEWLQRESS